MMLVAQDCAWLYCSKAWSYSDKSRSSSLLSDSSAKILPVTPMMVQSYSILSLSIFLTVSSCKLPRMIITLSTVRLQGVFKLGLKEPSIPISKSCPNNLLLFFVPGMVMVLEKLVFLLSGSFMSAIE